MKFTVKGHLNADDTVRRRGPSLDRIKNRLATRRNWVETDHESVWGFSYALFEDDTFHYEPTVGYGV